MILLDTHVAVWLALEAERLSRAAREAIAETEQAGIPLALCDITLWEVATLATRNRIRPTIPLDSFLEDLAGRFEVLNISWRACVRAAALPPAFPRDPVDRIIVGTALAEGIPLITADREIRKSKALPTIW